MLLAHRAEMGFGVGADIGEAGGIADLGGLAGVGVGPALALFEFHGVSSGIGRTGTEGSWVVSSEPGHRGPIAFVSSGDL